MVDSVLILVDAMDGPMPQTRFVTQKAFAMGFKPIVVVNKVDRPGARPDWVLDQTFDLFDKPRRHRRAARLPDRLRLGACTATPAWTTAVRDGDMTPLFEAIMKHVPPPPVDPDGPFQMRISQLDYNNYVGIIGVGRIQRGKVTHQHAGQRHRPRRQDAPGQGRCRCSASWAWSAWKSTKPRPATSSPSPASQTSASPTPSARSTRPKQLPALTVDEPTISMTFQVNNSPFAGNKDRSGGKFLTRRQLRERLSARRCTTSR